MAHIKDVKIGSNTYLIEPTVYAATAGDASAITAAVTNFALDTGVVVSLKITTANAANATLNVNGTGAKAIRYNNANIVADALKANRFYSLLYDGSYWQLLGELDTNTTYSAGTGIGISGTTISNSGVTGIKGNSESSYRTGQVNLTAANIGAVATSGNEDVNGNKNFKGITTLTIGSTYASSNGTVIAANSSALIQSPIPKYLWHDIWAFCRATTPKYYTSTDGSSWIEATLENRLFSHQEAWGESHVLSSSIKGSRWVWLKGNFDASMASWIVLGITYNSPSAHFNLTLETSSDGGSNWNTLMTATDLYYSQTPIWIKNTGTCQGSLRLTLTWNDNSQSNATLGLCSIRFLTSHWGDQGKGSEYEYPYTWDTNYNISPLSGAKFIGDVTGNVTGNVTGTATNVTGTVAIEHGGTNATTAAGARTSLGLGSIAVKADTDYLPVSYSNLDYSSTTTTNGVYPVNGQTLQNIIGLTSSTKVYGGAIQFGNTSDSKNYYGAQLIVVSASGASSAPHAYIRRMTDAPAWGVWSTLLDETNARTLLGVTDNSSNADVTSSDTNLITARTLYYQLAKKGYTTNTGTVTSVAASGSDGISISGSPITTSGTITIGLDLSTAINGLGEGTSPAQLNDYLVAQYAGGTKTTYHRHKVSQVVNATVVKAALETNSTHNDQYLRKDGTWATPPYPVTSVAGNTGAITADALRTSLGLSNAMHFLGVTTTNISTGTANTTATVAIDGSNVTATAGDVVLYDSQEYVWGNDKWNLLGDESSYKVKQTAVSDPTAASIASTTFIDTISQDANGVISATKKTLPTASSTVAGITKVGASGGAAAYNHTHAYVPYATGANDLNTIYDTGFYNITSGRMTNGPTNYGYGNLIVLDYRKHSGNAKPDFAGQIYLHQGSSATNGNTLYYRSSTGNTWSTWQMVAHTDSATAKGSANTPIYVTSTGVITEGTTYAGGTAVTLNNASKAGSTASFYAPTAGGTANTEALVGNGAISAPKWVDISPSITIGAGTASATPTINVTVLGQSGTAASLTTASTSVYGATKLQDGVASTSTALAATANAAYTASRSSLHTLGTTTKYYVTGVSGTSTNTAGDYFDTGIYSTAVAGELSAVRHSFNVSGTEKAYMYYNSTDDSIDFVFV